MQLLCAKALWLFTTKVLFTSVVNSVTVAGVSCNLDVPALFGVVERLTGVVARPPLVVDDALEDADDEARLSPPLPLKGVVRPLPTRRCFSSMFSFMIRLCVTTSKLDGKFVVNSVVKFSLGRRGLVEGEAQNICCLFFFYLFFVVMKSWWSCREKEMEKKICTHKKKTNTGKNEKKQKICSGIRALRFKTSDVTE